MLSSLESSKRIPSQGVAEDGEKESDERLVIVGNSSRVVAGDGDFPSVPAMSLALDALVELMGGGVAVSPSERDVKESTLSGKSI